MNASGSAGKGAQRQRAEITVYTLRNGVVRAEDQEDSLYAAIDLVANKVRPGTMMQVACFTCMLSNFLSVDPECCTTELSGAAGEIMGSRHGRSPIS